VERRLRAATLRALLGGALGQDLNQVRYFGFRPELPVVALAMTDVGPALAAELLVDEVLGEARTPYLSMISDDTLVVLLPAGMPEDLPTHLYSTLRQRLGRSISAGLGSPTALGEAMVSQRQALAAERAGRVEGHRLVRFDELGTYDLLLGGQSREALAAVASSALGPLQRYDAARSGDLVRSLEAFLAHNGQWEAAAAATGVHRHTMRNRMDKVSELLGRDLESAHVRAELWLAVKAQELVQLDT
jgi:PucR family transcriptional regulator, purine catabolism regulatory protein